MNQYNAKPVGIQIVAPRKDAFSPIKKYEAQMLGTNESLVEKDRGESGTANIPHGFKNSLPLVLRSTIIGNNRGALTLATISKTHVIITGNTFYRIFENKEDQEIE